MTSKTHTSLNWKVYAVIVLLVYLCIYILPLGVRPIMIPDEARYAEIPREMLTTSDWVSPHLNGLRYFEKPVFGYWLTAISMSVFGENAFAMRLPSALSAGFSAFAIFLLVRRFTGRNQSAVTAAMIYLSMLGVYLIGTYNILDSVFSFLVTAGFVAFYFSHNEPDRARRLFYLALLGAFCGAAFLAKGFLAFVLLASVIGPYVIWQKRWRELFTRGWIALAVAIIVIAPWAIMIHLREPEYWHYFFWEEHVRRFASDDAQHSEPIWFYLMYLPLLSLPWITQIPLAAKFVWSSDKDKSLIRYTMLWLIMPFVFFSIASGKLPTYVLPCLAPLAILLTLGMENYLKNIQLKNNTITAFGVSTCLMAIFFALIVVALVLIQNGVTGKVVWNAAEFWQWQLLAAAFIFGSGLLLFSLKTKISSTKIGLQAASVLAIMLVLPVVLPERTAAAKMPGEFLLQHAARITPETILLSDDILIHAVNWYYKRTDVYMTGAGESEHGLSFEGEQHRLLEGVELKKFIAEHLNKDKMVIIYHSDGDKSMVAMMPPQAQRWDWGLFVLWEIPVLHNAD